MSSEREARQRARRQALELRVSTKRENARKEDDARVIALRARCRASRSLDAQVPVVQATCLA